MASLTTTPPSPKPPPRPSPWLKRVLIPFWTVQLFLMLLLITASSFLATSATPSNALGIIVIYLFFEATCILLLLSEILLFARHILEPGTYLVLQVVKSTIWTVVFIIYIVRLATLGVSAHYVAPLAVFLGGDLQAIVLLVAFLGSLVYASVIYHRARRLSPAAAGPLSPATEHSGRTAPPRYSNGEGQRQELADEEMGKGRGREMGRERKELQGEGPVFELEAGGGWEGERAEGGVEGVMRGGWMGVGEGGDKRWGKRWIKDCMNRFDAETRMKT